MRKVKVAAVQMDVLLGDVEANLKKFRMMLARCAEQQVDFVVLPEMWLTGYSFRNLQALAKEHTPAALAETAELAKEYGINIVAGSFPEADGDHVFNTAYIFGRDGNLTEKYRKIHLFSYTGEERFIAGGDQLPHLITSADGAYGVTICYDIRFPEVFRPLGIQGAEIIFVPAQLPHPRLNHWRILLLARAIENQSFVVGCNRVGHVKKLAYFGHSMIIDPWGEVLAEGEEEEMILTAELDLDQVAEVREKMTVYQDRAPSVYNSFKE